MISLVSGHSLSRFRRSLHLGPLEPLEPGLSRSLELLGFRVIWGLGCLRCLFFSQDLGVDVVGLFWFLMLSRLHQGIYQKNGFWASSLHLKHRCHLLQSSPHQTTATTITNVKTFIIIIIIIIIMAHQGPTSFNSQLWCSGLFCRFFGGRNHNFIVCDLHGGRQGHRVRNSLARYPAGEQEEEGRQRG